jgi:hypothetical protein
MHKKVSSLAAALLKADRDVPRLDVGFDDETTRPVPLALIRMFSEQTDPTVSLTIALPEGAAGSDIQIDTGDSEEKKRRSSE